MSEEKVTKKQWFEIIKGIVEEADIKEAEYKKNMIDFIEKEITALENKAANAKERAAKEKAEGDQLQDSVQAVLTTNFQLIDEIFSQVIDEDGEVTRSKVTARLTKLVKAGIATKDMIKTEDKRKVTGYKLVEDASELGDAE